MSLRNTLFYLFVLLCTACSKDNPFVSKDVIDQLGKSKTGALTKMAYILNNDVYYLSNTLVAPKKITNSPNAAKQQIRISHDGSKLAYLNQALTPVIIDTLGNQITVLSNFSNISDMDWSADDQTLYMLTNNLVSFYGPALPLPKFSYPSGTNIYVLSMSVNTNNDISYIVQYDDPQTGTTYAAFYKANGSTSATQVNNSDLYNPKYIKFVAKTNDLMIGYDYNTSSRGMSAVEVYSSPYNATPLLINYNNYLVDPVYRADVSTLISGQSSTITGAYQLILTNLQTNTTAILSDVTTQPLYFDWK